MPHPRRASGLTLIELLLFIAIVGIALAAMLSVFVTATGASADPMIRRQQLAIAESLLREVQAMPFTWCDPTDANAVTATSNAGCATLTEGPGPEVGQTRYGPNSFNNVNDYAGFSMAGIRDLSNTLVGGLSGYGASVAVTAAALDSVTAASGDALQITVTVTGPDSSSLVLQGWRTRYAPDAPF
ncbi:type II secretion system protein [Roseateles cellulosilyticus]|uniref:Type II secretion system GspH family protein n=1 Tax=Pelomonas cellulosilytica TaxID=2906762 RepID=A0ABS8XYF7_9BURK|nr:type II secretion system protein [Pelomonas sp. P8]MCE4555867.1 type II secretion system GspH family protein [Pelomonas sp. P8]